MKVRPALNRVAAAADAATGQSHQVSPFVDRIGVLLLLTVLFAAIGFRLYLIATTDFPLNDGALFLEFVRASAASFPGLPTIVEFNGLTLPYAYPPLSFWVGAALTKLGADPLELVRVVPILLNISYVLLFALLLLRMGGSRLFTAIALLFFCTRLRSFEWLVMGGGMSRGFGALFLILALLAVTTADRQRSALPTGRMLLAGAAVAAAILSHLEWGILAAASVVASRALDRPGFRQLAKDSLLAGATALALVTPWLMTVYAMHGLAPFLAASATSRWDGEIAELFISLARTAVGNPLIALGIFPLLLQRQFFWPVFMLLCILTTPRHAHTPLALPISILAAAGTLFAYNFLRTVLTSARTAGVVVALAVIALVGIRIYRDFQGSVVSFRPLSPEQRSAMHWVAAHHRGATYATVTQAEWPSDHAAEWFPTLTGARNVVTVQGREWLRGADFAGHEAKSMKVNTAKDCPELTRALAAYGPTQFLWVETMQHCFEEAGYEQLYSTKGVSIFRSRQAGSGK